MLSQESDRPVEADEMVGDARSGHLNLGWRHTVDLESIAERMVNHDLESLRDPGVLWLNS